MGRRDAGGEPLEPRPAAAGPAEGATRAAGTAGTAPVPGGAAASTGAEGPEPSVLPGHVALLAVQLCFGFFPVFGRLALDPERGFAPWAVASWRLAVGAGVFGLLALAWHRRRVWIGLGDLGRVFLLAQLGIVANQALFLSGLARSSAVDAGMLVCLIPVFTFVVAAVAGQERFSVSRGLGVAIAFGGLLPLFLGRGAASDASHLLGNALMVVNTLCYAAYLVVSKPLTRRHPPLVLLAWLYVASLPALPFFLALAPLGPASPGDGQVWGSLAYVLVFPTLVAYLLNLFALGRVRASTTAFYIYLQPLIAALGAHHLLGEPLEANLLWAAVGLVLGSALVLRRPGRA